MLNFIQQAGNVVWLGVGVYFTIQAGQDWGWWVVPIIPVVGLLAFEAIHRYVGWRVDRDYR